MFSYEKYIAIALVVSNSGGKRGLCPDILHVQPLHLIQLDYALLINPKKKSTCLGTLQDNYTTSTPWHLYIYKFLFFLLLTVDWLIFGIQTVARACIFHFHDSSLWLSFFGSVWCLFWYGEYGYSSAIAKAWLNRMGYPVLKYRYFFAKKKRLRAHGSWRMSII